MKNLWAPWRKEYILSEKKGNCFLCEALVDDQDRKNLILYRGKECFCILNKYPYNNGHAMVVPNRHSNELSALSNSEMLELLTITSNVKDIIARKMNPEGFNIGMNLGKVAGAGLEEHLHLHIVPRWNGDTNFMPVIAATKVMPQSLEDLFADLERMF
ncbi:MAG: HIT domain-containing protein [Candidatus Scalindua sp. AMX11]|nr:MAG: HIT domain-containing protein [Candidatus Scalindua sp.]NOG82336.1 HIT domain-containing protein [Planctomycetota bacterium]RZV66903.1 MAG: HIT domain-containing protein [Candidatus Scalindua sp. SCAELEC01]TDE63281.1 MAG: HIT domain-containing protein [Candidatus Scalindua sp. AMX11]GJQ60541.1 MAG: hydrolase [Candidatus Scalindua sp.]